MNRLTHYIIILVAAVVLSTAAWTWLVQPAYTGWLIRQSFSATTQEEQLAARDRLYRRLAAHPDAIRLQIEQAMSLDAPESILPLRAVLDRAQMWSVESASYSTWLQHTENRLSAPSTNSIEAQFIAEQLLRFAPSHPPTQATFWRALTSTHATRFNELQHLSDQQGQWVADDLPAALWIRWLKELADSNSSLNQQLACRQIAIKPTLPDKAWPILDQLISAQDDKVQLATIQAMSLHALLHPTRAIVYLDKHESSVSQAVQDEIHRVRRNFKPRVSIATSQKNTIQIPDHKTLIKALHSSNASLRALACYTLAQQNPPPTEDFINNLLEDYNDHAKRAGALLAAMTLQCADTIDTKDLTEDRPEVREVLRLALWRMGRYDAMNQRVAQLIAHQSSLRHEALALLLFIRDRRALDALLTPFDPSSPWAIQTLYPEGWVNTLQEALPQTAPSIAPSTLADKNQIAFKEAQVWYRIHRRSIWRENLVD